MKRVVKLICCLLACLLLLTGCKSKQEKLMEAGLKYLNENNYEQAILSFTEAIDIDPKNVQAYLNRALAYNGSGDKEKAVEDLISALGLGETANSVPSELLVDVANKYIEDAGEEAPTEEVMNTLAEKGFFADPSIIEVLGDLLPSLVERLTSEYKRDEKPLSDLLKYLGDTGLLKDDATATVIVAPLKNIVFDVIKQMAAEGKTMDDVREYIKNSCPLSDTMIDSIINELKSSIATSGIAFYFGDLAKMRKTLAKAIYQEADWYDGGSHAIAYSNEGSSSTYFYTQIVVSGSRQHYTYMAGIKCTVEYDSKGTDTGLVTITNGSSNKLEFKVVKGVITKFTAKGNIKTLYANYLKSISYWNKIIKKSGYTVNNLYDNNVLLALFMMQI